MKALKLILFLYGIPCILLSGCTTTVTDEIVHIKSYEVTITTISQPSKPIKCILLQLNDSSLFIESGGNRSLIDVSDIQQIKVLIKRDVLKAAGLGFVAGFGAGAALALMFANQDEYYWENTLGAALGGGIIIAGSSAISAVPLTLKYPVNGRLKYYQSIKEKLEKYTGNGLSG